jgi:hypothetical protein
MIHRRSRVALKCPCRIGNRTPRPFGRARKAALEAMRGLRTAAVTLALIDEELGSIQGCGTA